jgi:hypothetical protein
MREFVLGTCDDRVLSENDIILEAPHHLRGALAFDPVAPLWREACRDRGKQRTSNLPISP